MVPQQDDEELERILSKYRDPSRSLEMQVEELTVLFRERIGEEGGGSNGEIEESHGDQTSNESRNA